METSGLVNSALAVRKPGAPTPSGKAGESGPLAMPAGAGAVSAGGAKRAAPGEEAAAPAPSIRTSAGAVGSFCRLLEPATKKARVDAPVARGQPKLPPYRPPRPASQASGESPAAGAPAAGRSSLALRGGTGRPASGGSGGGVQCAQAPRSDKPGGFKPPRSVAPPAAAPPCALAVSPNADSPSFYLAAAHATAAAEAAHAAQLAAAPRAAGAPQPYDSPNTAERKSIDRALLQAGALAAPSVLPPTAPSLPLLAEGLVAFEQAAPPSSPDPVAALCFASPAQHSSEMDAPLLLPPPPPKRADVEMAVAVAVVSDEDADEDVDVEVEYGDAFAEGDIAFTAAPPNALPAISALDVSALIQQAAAQRSGGGAGASQRGGGTQQGLGSGGGGARGSLPPAVAAASRPSDTPRSVGQGIGAPSTQLEHWGLPGKVLEVYRSRGVKQMYAWQAEALSQPGVADGRSLVYCAPTSGGKSLVADVLLMRCIARTGRAALVALPFVALCDEKAAQLAPLAAALGRRVHKQYGTHGGPLPPGRLGVIVATYEKANAILTRLVELDRFHEIGCVVVDELHMLADGDRGSLVELLLTKTLYVSTTEAAHLEQAGTGAAPALVSQHVRASQALAGGSQFDGRIQIVGMSATMPNFDSLARWLDAAPYVTTFRPVPLSYHVKVGAIVQNSTGEATRAPLPRLPGDPEHLAFLTQETLDAGGSVLVFCGFRKACELSAHELAAALVMPTPPCEPGDDVDPRAQAVESLHRAHDGNASKLAACVDKGVAWHHAGLTGEEREVIESGFRSGCIRVICCTSTLAAGVNLPARRVLIRHDFQGIPANTLDAATYQQMAGRAGRAGLDATGESILFAAANATPARITALRELVKASPLKLVSVLTHRDKGAGSLQRVMLEAVTSGLVVSQEDMERYMRCTLMCALNDFQTVEARSKEALYALQKAQLVEWCKEQNSWRPQRWGKAASASYLSVAMAADMRRDIDKARDEGVVTATELHTLFLVAPQEEPPKWLEVLHQFAVDVARMDATSLFLRVCARVGINMEWIMKTSSGVPMPPPPGAKSRAKWAEQSRLATRLYYASILCDVVQEVPTDVVAAKWKVERGWLSSLQDRAGRNTASVAALTEGLGYDDMAKLFGLMQERISSGAKADIMTLTVMGVSPTAARAMYRAGFHTLEAIAALPGPDALVDVLMSASKREGRAAECVERRRAEKILRDAREAVSERVALLREQADEVAALAGGPGAAAAATRLELSPDKRIHIHLDAPPSDAPHTARCPAPAVTATQFSLGMSAPSLSAAIAAAAAAVSPDPPPLPPPPRLPPPVELHPEVEADVSSAQAVHERAKGCVIVCNAPSFEALRRRWDGAAHYSFCVAWEPASAAHPGGAGPRARGLALAFEDASQGCVFYVPFAKTALGEAHRCACLLRLAQARGVKASVDVKDQVRALACRAPAALAPAACLAALGSGVEDVRIMAWLLSPGDDKFFQKPRADGRPESVLTALGLTASAAAALAASAWRHAAASSVPHGAAAAAAARGAAVAREAASTLRPRLAAANLLPLLRTLEMPLVPVLAAMERAGMPFDPDVLALQHEAAEARLLELRGKVRKMTGVERLDLSSPKALSAALFYNMKFTPPGVPRPPRPLKTADTKEAKRQYSTKREVLEDLARGDPRARPVVSAILEYREVSHKLGFSQTYLTHSVRAPNGFHRIHASIFQTNTETGRLAMDEPSLHNVPHPVEFPFARAQQDAPLARLAARAAFRPPVGRLLLVGDFKQFELRMMVHFGRDEALGGLIAGGVDPFTVLASRWCGKAPEAVLPEERSKAKAIAYGLLYGKTHNTLAFELDMPVNRSLALLEAFKASVPGITRWLGEVVEEARGRQPVPHVTTLSGRRRDLPLLLAEGRANSDSRSRAERQAVNTVCQGSAADVLKLALIMLQRHLAADPAQRATLVLSVHDDVVLEVDAAALPWAAALVRAVLTGAGVKAGVRVPLEVQLQAGPSWDALRPLDGL